jgi:hypothetical protein
MLTVVADAKAVERQLVEGELICPSCSAGLGPWGWARPRVVGRGDRCVRVRPRRSRCRGCRATHVLLPALLLLRRCDLVELIGRALVARAAGAGMRPLARAVEAPRSTVRGWLARFVQSAERLRAHFTRWALWLDPNVVRIEPSGSGFADAVAALVAAGEAARRRLGAASRWTFASAATGGRLLCNTSSPFPAPWTGPTLPPGP